jgi:hypothetical protein
LTKSLATGPSLVIRPSAADLKSGDGNTALNISASRRHFLGRTSFWIPIPVRCNKKARRLVALNGRKPGAYLCLPGGPPRAPPTGGAAKCGAAAACGAGAAAKCGGAAGRGAAKRGGAAKCGAAAGDGDCGLMAGCVVIIKCRVGAGAPAMCGATTGPRVIGLENWRTGADRCSIGGRTA